MLFIVGDVLDAGYQEACVVAGFLQSLDTGLEVKLKPLVEDDWLKYLPELKNTHKGVAYEHPGGPFIVHSIFGYIGSVDDLVTFGEKELGYRSSRGMPVYADAMASKRTEGMKEFYKLLQTSGRSYCFLEFEMEGAESAEKSDISSTSSRIVIELYNDLCPKTCQNFATLCSGVNGKSEATGSSLHYKGTKIHRVVKDGWIQGGDLAKDGSASECIWGGFFPDESFTTTHDEVGMVGMSSNGAHSNGSQFYITLKPLPSLDGKRVVFGKVRSGRAVLDWINNAAVSVQRPTKKISVKDSGILALS